MKYVGGIVFAIGCIMFLSYLVNKGSDANGAIIGGVLLIVGVLLGFRDYGQKTTDPHA